MAASPSSSSSSSTAYYHQIRIDAGLSTDEARSIMSGGPILQELIDSPQILTATKPQTRKEVFSSLFFLIADSRSVFTSGVRHDSADAMTLLTQILNPRTQFARSSVAVELCTFIASLGLSGLRRLRLDRHILSSKEGVAPAAVAFIMALSIAASELSANTLLNGNSEAEMRLRAMTSSFSHNGLANDSSPNLAQSFNPLFNNNRAASSSSSSTTIPNNTSSPTTSTSSSSPTTNLVSTVTAPASSNIANDPLLRRDLQAHETARPHRSNNNNNRPATATIGGLNNNNQQGGSSSSSSSRLSRYHYLPTVPAGQQMPGSNPAYVRGSTEVHIHLTSAAVPSAVKSHARAFGLGGRSSIPKMTQGADLEKRFCLPLKLIFPGLNDESSSTYVKPAATTAATNGAAATSSKNSPTTATSDEKVNNMKRSSSSSAKKSKQKRQQHEGDETSKKVTGSAISSKKKLLSSGNTQQQQQQHLRRRGRRTRKSSTSRENDDDNLHKGSIISTTSFSSSPLSAAAATVQTPGPSAYDRIHGTYRPGQQENNHFSDPNDNVVHENENNNDHDIAREERISEAARQLDIGHDETAERRKRKLQIEREREEAERNNNDDYYTEQNNRRHDRNNDNRRNDDDDDETSDEDEDGISQSRVRREQARRLKKQLINKDSENDQQEDIIETRHNVRPLMKVDQSDAQEASREAEEAAQKGNAAIDDNANVQITKTTATTAQQSLSLSTTPSITPDTRSRANSTTYNSPPRNPAFAKLMMTNSQGQTTTPKLPSSFTTTTTTSFGSVPPLPASSSKPLILVEDDIDVKHNNYKHNDDDDDDDDDLMILQRKNNNNKPNNGSSAALSRIPQQQPPLSPYSATRKRKSNQKSNKTLVERFLTMTPAASSSSSQKVILETAPTCVTMSYHTPTSTYPLCSYKVIFSPLQRRGVSVPTFKIVSGHRHNAFVVGTGESQKLSSLSSSSSLSSAESNTNNNVMIACCGDNSFSQCSGSPVLFSTSSPTIPSSSATTASASAQNNSQQQHQQLPDNAALHINRQFVSVGVSGKAQFTQIVSGAFFTACVTVNGEVYLWGDNYYGQCSVGSSLTKKGPLQETPNKVLFRGNKVTQISCGATFVIALTEGDRVLGWGSVHLLGIGTGADAVPCEKCLIGSNAPHGNFPISSLLLGAEETTSTSTTSSSLASQQQQPQKLPSPLISSTSLVSFSSPSSSSSPASAANSFYLPIENEMQRELISSVSTVPCSIAGLCGKQIINIASGNFHSIAVTKTGAVYSWGFGGHGQLGVGSQTNASVPKKLHPSHFQPMQVESVFCGANHSAAVAKGGFALWLWGDNRHGQCGVSSFDQVLKDEADDFLGKSSSSSAASRRSISASSTLSLADSCVLVPTRVHLGFKQQRASIITVALGTNRTCILFSDGDVAIFGSQIPFCSFSGGGNCSGASSGTGCHGVFAAPTLLSPSLAICQLSARHDHVSITACKRDIAVITIGLLPGGFDFGCRIEFLTKAHDTSCDDGSGEEGTTTTTNDSYYYSPALAPYCGDLLSSSRPVFPKDSNNEKSSSTQITSVENLLLIGATASSHNNSALTSTESNKSNIITTITSSDNDRFLPSPYQKCIGNPVCVAVGGSHTIIGTGFFSNASSSSSSSSSPTSSFSNNNNNNTSQSIASSSGQNYSGGSLHQAGSSTSSQNNYHFNSNNKQSGGGGGSSSGSSSTESSCVVTYGSGTWGQLGLGQNVWKHVSSSTSLTQQQQPPSPSSSTTTASPFTSVSSSSSPNPQQQTILVKHPAPIFFSTSKEASSPYHHRNAAASQSPTTSERSTSRVSGGSSSIQNNNNQQQRRSSSSHPSTSTSNQSSNHHQKSTGGGGGGVKLTLRSLASGHAFCFAIFSAPTINKDSNKNNQSSTAASTPPPPLKHPTLSPHHKVQQQEDTIVYFWGNNNHHQSGIAPPPPPPPPPTPSSSTVALDQQQQQQTSHDNNENHGENDTSNNESNNNQPSISTRYDSPVLVASLSGKGVVQIACGSFFAIALASDGNVYSWGLFDCCGLGPFNEFDEEHAARSRLLHKSTTTSNNNNNNNSEKTSETNNKVKIVVQSLTKEQRNCICYPLKITDMIFPPPLQDDAVAANSSATKTTSSKSQHHQNSIVQVAAGPWHCAVLSRRGQVYTWGFGTNHRLGLGADDLRTHLKPVCVDLPVRVRDISCGHANTLAISVNESSLFVWGDNEHGQCGVGGGGASTTTSSSEAKNCISEPKNVISNGVRSAAITRTCCIAVMWNGSILISGVLENNNDTTSISIGISSKNYFTSIQSAILAAAKRSNVMKLESSLKAQPGITVSLANEILTLFPAPPPTSAFLDDDDDDEEHHQKQQQHANKKKTTPTSPNSNVFTSIDDELGGNNNSKNNIGENDDDGDEDYEHETRSFYAMDVVASLQHACLIVEVNRPNSSEWSSLRKAMSTGVM